MVGTSPVTAYLGGPVKYSISTPGGTKLPTMFMPEEGFMVIQTEPQKTSSQFVLNTNLYQIPYSSINGHINFDAMPPKVSPISIKYSGQSSAPFNTGYRSVLIDGVEFIFSSKGGSSLNVDTFTLGKDSSGTWKGNWAVTKKLNYVFDGMSKNVDNFRVFGSDDGVYLFGRFTNSAGSYVDISFIPLAELLGTEDQLTYQTVYQLKNNDSSRPGFNPVPDTELFDGLVTTHLDPDNPVFIWAGDSGQTVCTWYIGPNGYGQKTLIDKNSWTTLFRGKPRTVSFTEGCYAEDPFHTNNINAIACGDYENTKSSAIGTYSCDITSFGSNTWQKVVIGMPSGEFPLVMADNGFTVFPIVAPIVGSANSESCYLVGFTYDPDDKKYTDDFYQDGNFILTFWDGNLLIPNSTQGKFDTSTNFTAYGNLSIPVGFVDGVAPFSFNGFECDGVEVTSEVELSKSDTKTTETSGSSTAKASVSYGHEFLKKRVGVDAGYSYSIENKDGTETEFKQTTTDTFSRCSMGENHSYGYILYLSPNLITNAYNVADYEGNLPSDNPEILYLSKMDPSNPLTSHIQGYNITSPPTSGPLAGMMKSPYFDDFDDWSWASWSGGWGGRDWSQSPYAGSFTATSLGDHLEWSLGSQQTTEYEMTTTTSQTTTVENEIETSAKVLGFGASGSYTWEAENVVTNAVNQGISFHWSMKVADDDVCGYDTIRVEPILLTPIAGKPVPWVPPTYSAYQPWLLTYNLIEADPSEGCNLGASAIEQKIKTSVIPANAGTITLPKGGIAKGMTGQVQAIPADGYQFLHWEAYGLDLTDSASPVTNATVKSQLSTLRAIFGKSSSSLVDTAIIAVRNGSTGNQVKIQGTLPTGFNNHIIMHLKSPVEIRVGDLIFPFGPTVGDRTVISDHEIAFTTEDPTQGVSHLRIDRGSGKWWFMANQVQNLAGYGVKSNIVRMGIGGKNISVTDDVLMTGTESIDWSGADELVTNNVFSLQNATVRGTIRYLGDESGTSSLMLSGGKLNTGSVNATMPVKFSMNGVELALSGPSSVNGNQYTYSRTGPDLNATVSINNDTKGWNVELSGKKLSHRFWETGVPVSLQIGTAKASSVIHPARTIALKTPNLAHSSEETLLSGMSF